MRALPDSAAKSSACLTRAPTATPRSRAPPPRCARTPGAPPARAARHTARTTPARTASLWRTPKPSSAPRPKDALPSCAANKAYQVHVTQR